MFIICRKIHTTSDLYSRIAELTSKIIIDAQTENFYLVRFLSLIRPFIKGEVSVEKIIQLIRNVKFSTSQQFVHLKVPSFSKRAKWTKPTANRWRRLYLEQEHSNMMNIIQERSTWMIIYTCIPRRWSSSNSNSIDFCVVSIGYLSS